MGGAPGALLLAATLLFGFSSLDLAAAEKAPATEKSKAPPEAQAKAPSEKSIEALAETVRQSVVVVSHFGRDGKQDGQGAGFIVAPDGLIATSLHVIGEARPISVQLANGKRYDVTEIYAWDRKLDLALIRIAADKLPALPLGDSDELKQGTPIVAMGNPLGLEHSIVQGVVSATRDFDGVAMIQLAIPIEPGNSGGPLLDRQGRVHGLLTMKAAMSANLGFAMPINALKPLLNKPNPVPMDHWVRIGALNLKEWTPLMGARWSRKAGRIQVEGFGSGFGGRSLCLSQKPVPERPYEVAVTVRLEDESGAAGLVFEADGGDKHYGFYPTGGQLRLTRFDGPNIFSWNIIETVPSPHYRPGEWNTIKVRVEAERILCYVNNQLVVESTDKKFTSGQAGLAKFRDTRAMFKDFEAGASVRATTPQLSAEVVSAVTKQLQNFSGELEPALIAALQPHADATQTLLSERARKLEQEAAQLRKLAVVVHRQAVQTNLVAALQGPEESIDLFHAALLVAKLDNPEVDIAAYRQQLAEMARELAASLPANCEDIVKLAALTKYLFTENGFHGSYSDYYNRANSYMNEVLDDREGLPITLSVLFIELARRIGLDNVVGVGLPGHFVVKHIPKQGAEQLIDVFNGGKVLTRAEANDLVLNLSGASLREEHLQPSTKRAILIRMLGNLLSSAQRTGTNTDSLRYLDLILALAPESTTDRLMRAMLRRQRRDNAGAKQDLKWLLDHQPPGIDLEQVTELYRSL